MTALARATGAHVGGGEGADGSGGAVTALALTGCVALMAPRDESFSQLPGSPKESWLDAPLRLGRMDRASAWATVVVRRLLAETGLDAPGACSDIGLLVGTALGCAATNETYHRGLVRSGAAHASPMHFAATVPSAPVGELACVFGFRGHQTLVMAGRRSGLEAVAEARRALRLGRAPAVVVVAVDVFGPDRRPVLTGTGSLAAHEAVVALLLEPADATSGRPPRAFLQVRSSAGSDSAGAADPGETTGPDFLGAAGLVELAAWLPGPSPALEVTVVAGGVAQTLVATR